MFAKFLARLQLRRSTAFLLERCDDHLLADIGLTRDELEAMHLGVAKGESIAKVARFHSLPVPRSLPVTAVV